mmetsp:Transcript_15127/g.43031  ORF Transcript_15127/g.43031 Transcript_15127/m.43031 type:complete len:235 (+) Transcript_15127:57-761(+)|eukprot:CAMPEP_0119133898 /NCGR_PEP_ID=MMETSP1310-20130426/14303_1 /TAXON_ID=464262 /ORGANISM="Genus nov. species nov., Strain RCC2339" /LENGTH=234 /DNA_ID=CAMNT_0007124629 /DNA_START=71 /DNA_END=775 /DNA_ORIENTATION=+
MSWFGFGGSADGEEVVFPEIPTASSEDEICAIGAKALAEFEKVIASNDGWNDVPFEEAGHEDIKLFDKIEEGSPIVPVKAIGSVNASAQKVAALYKERNAKKIKATIDETILGLEILKEFGNVTIRYASFYLAPMVSNREFVFVQSEQTDADGSFVAATTSINFAEKKQASGQVRGVIAIEGVKVEQDAENPNKCTIYRTLQVDPKGMLPSWVVNMSKSNVAKQIVKVRACVDK